MEQGFDWEMLAALASCVSAIGLVLVWRQISQSRKIWKEDHERSRKEMTLRLMNDRAQCVDRTTNIVTRFVDRLDKDQAAALFKQEKVVVAADKKDSLGSVLDVLQLPDLQDLDGGTITVPFKAVAEIRAQAIRYLNQLEITLVAWQHEIADRTIIEAQFTGLYCTERGDYMLENFRKAPGRAAFPAIEEFVDTVCTCTQGTKAQKLGDG